MAGELRPALFLDRDGTVNEEVHYLDDPSEVRLLAGAAGAIRRFREAGWLCVVVTNQSGVARGYLTEETLARIHDRLQALLRERGAEVDAFYWCPHLPGGAVAAYDEACDCRKPKPGMLLRAARELGIDLARSVACGDSERDITAARRAGCAATYLVCAEDMKTAATGTVRSLEEVAVPPG